MTLIPPYVPLAGTVCVTVALKSMWIVASGSSAVATPVASTVNEAAVAIPAATSVARRQAGPEHSTTLDQAFDRATAGRLENS